MQKDTALSFINDALLESYDEDAFLKLVHNLFGAVEVRDRERKGNIIYDAFEDHVASYKYLVKYTDPDGEELNVLAVKLKSARSLGRARTMQRNFAAEYLRRKEFCDTALVAYYADDATDWRLSLVRLEYRTVQDEDSGKVSTEEDLTPARRFSFLVGAGEPSHTARKQLLPLVQDDALPTLAALDAAFDIEVVTDDFFEDYKAHFLALKENLDGLVAEHPAIAEAFGARGIDTAAFAKKLLGQIVFLYFLQKKGWLGVERAGDGSFGSWGDGPKDFLRRLFEHEYTEYDNFFNDCLEPLFYEALATERGTRAYYSRFDCRIPFLNGGLFEPVGYGRATRGAALGFLAKLYLNTRQWQEAADTAQEIIGSGTYDLFDEGSRADLFDLSNEGDNEFIFVAPFPENETGGLGNTYLSHAAPPGYQFMAPPKVNFAAQFKIRSEFLGSFVPEDERLEAFVFEYVNLAGDTVQLGENDVRSFKYPEDPEADGDVSGNDYPLLRYADILLARAEALNELGGPNQESIDLINEVREVAGVAPISLGDVSSQQALRDFILAERGREFHTEGLIRRQDLVRQGAFIERARDRGKPAADYQVLFPIPQDEIDKNPNLEQNEGY